MHFKGKFPPLLDNSVMLKESKQKWVKEKAEVFVSDIQIKQ